MSVNFNGNKGFSIIEILVIISIVVIALASLLNLTLLSLKLSVSTKESHQANFLAKEMIEIVRTFRDGTDWHSDGLGSLVPGVAYYPSKDDTVVPASWTLIEGEQQIGQFSRKIVFHHVHRDNNDNIVEQGGIKDENTKKVTAFVSWRGKQIEIITYLTNWR